MYFKKWLVQVTLCDCNSGPQLLILSWFTTALIDIFSLSSPVSIRFLKVYKEKIENGWPVENITIRQNSGQISCFPVPLAHSQYSSPHPRPPSTAPPPHTPENSVFHRLLTIYLSLMISKFVSFCPTRIWTFLKTGAKTLHLIELSKLMFHEGKSRRYKGIESCIYLTDKRTEKLRRPKKIHCFFADTLSWSHLEAIGTVIQPVIKANSTERLKNCELWGKKSKTQSHLGDRTLKLQRGKDESQAWKIEYM